MFSNYQRYAPILLAFIAWVLPQSAHAGAWTPKKGSAYIKFSFSQFESTESFDFNGDRQDDRALFEDNSFGIYAEYGLHDRLALFGSVTHKDILRRATSAGITVEIDNSGFSDLDLGLRYQLLSGPHVVSAALTVKLPYLYDDDPFFPLGNDQEDIEARFLYGKGLGSFYVGAEAAYRWRLQGLADEFRYLLEGGFQIQQKFYGRVKIDGTQSLGDFVTPVSFGNPTLTAAYDLIKWELSAGWNFNSRWGLEATYADHADGKNIAIGDTLQLAVIWQW